MRRLFTLFIIQLFITSAFAQECIQIAPVSKEFKDYLEEFNASDKKDQKEVTGYIPSPLVLKYQTIDESRDLKSFPSSYDLRDNNLVTSVKDQGNWGTCWTFGAMASLESRMLKLGWDTYDLSEQNLATCHGFYWGKDDGGNSHITSAYLTRLSGPILESDDPYDNTSACDNMKYDPVMYLLESRFLPKNKNALKNAILKYGAIPVSMHYTNSAYNSTNYTYYYNGEERSNHTVTAVGWDDNKYTLAGPGAWIIKNSYGASWGDNGYFYWSFEDVLSGSGPTIYTNIVEKTGIDTLFMYDKFSSVSSVGYSDKDAYALIKYTAPQSYIVNRIGSFVNTEGATLDIAVYDDFDGAAVSNLLYEAEGLQCGYPGYYTFEIDPITVSDDFYIVVHYHTPGYQYPIPIEVQIDEYAYPGIQSGVCWISRDATSWTAIGSDTNSPYDLCIRAYAKEDLPIAKFSADRKHLCISNELAITDLSAGSGLSYDWDFGNDATPLTASTPGPHTVTYTKSGTKTVTLTVNNADGSDVYSTQIVVSDDINVIISNHNIYTRKDDSTLVIADCEEGESFNWSPAGLFGLKYNNVAYVKPTVDSTKIYVTATQGACEASDSATVYILDTPENDDVENAIELSFGSWEGSFTNENATAQTGEPMPPLGDCNSQSTWCDGEGLDNSVWFKFTANENESVSVDTRGFDSQIALYDAASASDILDGNYSILAANDDYHDESEDYAAGITRVTGLTQGKTYWIQLDGSYGGVEGNFDIKISQFGLGIFSEIEEQQPFVYPNPNNGSFYLNLEDIGINPGEKVVSKIYSITGQMMYTTENVSTGKEFNYDLSPGIYFITIESDESVYMDKFIVQ